MLALVGGARSDNGVLTAVVGTNDGFDISLNDQSSAPVRTLAPGAYTVLVHDRSALHNFRLLGPGVDMATSVLATGDSTWSVTFVDGYYRFLCDPHAVEMHGAFVVGNGARPLTATVVAGKAPVLRDAFGLPVTSSVAGRYVLTVHDLALSENFRLRGLGVNRATAVPSRGTTRWSLVLAPGTYTYFSDTHPRRRRTLTVRAG